MIFRKPFEENFIGKAPNYGYPFISTLNCRANWSALLAGKARMSLRWSISCYGKTSSFLKN